METKNFDTIYPISVKTALPNVAIGSTPLTILHQKLIELVLAAACLQVDGPPRTRSVGETRIEVLPDKGKRVPRGSPHKKKKRKTHRGYLWGYHAVHEKLAFFDYSPTREADNPAKHLKHFDGVIQTDCYDVYGQIRTLYPALTHSLTKGRKPPPSFTASSPAANSMRWTPSSGWRTS
ncbi:MAG: transposase [Lewinellaceae bacterium]|nr:transposase [Lewinellaceae bacterium]